MQQKVNNFKCLCGNENYQVKAYGFQMRFSCYGHNKNVVECNKCGLIQLFPLWTPEELNDLYLKYSEKRDFAGQKKFKHIDNYLKKYIGKKDVVLEIGCGKGDNVRWLRNDCYNIIGVDRDPTVQEKDVIFTCEFEDYDICKKFDFIYAIHVLEHIDNPVRFINKIIDKLNYKGRLLLELPNIEDPLYTIYKNKKYSEYMWYPYHIYNYSFKTVSDLFRRLDRLDMKDVRIIRKQRYGILNHMRWLIKGKPGNINFHIPIVDDIYKFILVNIFKVSDTLIVTAQRNN